LLVVGVVLVIRKVGPFFTALQQSTDDLNLVVQENLTAIRVVKSYVREEEEKAKFTQRSQKLRAMAERAFGFVVTFMPLMMLLMGGTITAVLWIGGHYVYEGTMLSGDLIAFFTYVSEILMSLMMVSMVMILRYVILVIICRADLIQLLTRLVIVAAKMAVRLNAVLRIPVMRWLPRLVILALRLLIAPEILLILTTLALAQFLTS
jgi:ATP-binding cassette subfamily B protein